MPVSRDYEARVEYDGEEFTIVLRWTESGMFGARLREEHHVWVDEADLPRELVRDLKESYTERDGEATDTDDDEE